jgi:DNA-binding NarL/FixJ family response regulator
LIGREPELAAVAAAIADVARGAGRTLLVHGEAGIGKTRLLSHVHETAAARGFAVFAGRASELERDLPRAPLLEALDPIELPGERWEAHRTLRRELDARGARGRVALVLDDIHWADAATLDFLDHLLRHPGRRPLLLVVASRGPAVERLAVAVRAGGGTLVDLPLAPLDRAASRALLGDVADPERLFRESGGNPLLLEELVRAGGGVPASIVAIVRSEVAGLSAPARALLQGAAIAGDPFDLELASAIAGGESGLNELLEHALIHAAPPGRRYAFRHPVIRGAVYETTPESARLTGHAMAAAVLAAAGSPLPERAHHLAHAAMAGDADAAATLRAAATMVRAQAPGIAADWLVAAHRIDGANSDASLADTLVEAGRLEEALAAVEAGGDAAAIAGATVERLLGRHSAARRRLRRALERADAAEQARLHAHLALSAYELGDYEEVSASAEAARAAGSAEPVTLAAAASMLAVTGAFAGDTAAADVQANTALAAIEAATDAELARGAELLTAIAWGVLALERLEDGLSVARRGAAAARRAGNGPAATPLDVAAVLSLGLLGRIDEAVAAADETEQRARLTGLEQGVQWSLWMRAWALLERGDLDAALAAAEESVALARRLDDSALATIADAVLGAVLVGRGEPARGRDLLAAYDVDPGWICRWAVPLVEADIALEDLIAAESHATRAAELAESVGLSGPRAAAARAQALVALARDDSAAAHDHATAALARAEEIGAALDAARARLLAGRATDDVDALADAAERAGRCGARRVRDEAVRELRRRGRRVGRGGARAQGEHGIDSLSPREREIAELVAAGHTNREIAARLYLSEKTVETHLSRAFAKLGVRTRAAVAARVASVNG